MSPALRVSICGGGLGGLTLAVAIAKYGTLQLEIFEAGPTITTTGAGIGFYARAMGVMKELGLYDELVKTAIKPPQENTSTNFRKSDQQDGYHWFTRDVPGGCLLVHRQDFVDILLRHIPASCKIYTSKRLDFYDVHSATGEITLRFSDGSSAVTDVLVGADGIHSATRETMYQSLVSSTEDSELRKRLLGCIDPVWTGTLVYRSLIPAEKLSEEHPEVEMPNDLTVHLGKHKHIVIYPVSQGRLINAVFFVQNKKAFGTPFEDRWVMDVSEKEISDQFEDWEVRVRTMAKCVEKPSRWALHSLRPLPRYVNGNVVLLGDAAHAMTPYFGAGAGQAMEDAIVLGRLLTHELTDRKNITDALKTYEQIRLPFANNVTQRSQDVGDYYGLDHISTGGLALGPDRPEELDHVRKFIVDAWAWQSESARVWDEAEELWREHVNSTIRARP